MKIGMLADIYKPHVSGITTYISLNKARLEQKGHEVYVFTFGYLDYDDEEPNVIRSSGVPLFSTGAFLNLRYTRQARDLVRTMDIVHVHHPFFSGPVALRYCKPMGIPIVFTNHTRYDLYAQAYAPMFPDILSETAIQAFMPTFCRSVSLVVSPSDGMRDVLLSYGVDAPIDVLPNGLDLKPFYQPSDPIDRSQFGFEWKDVVLAYSGRLGPEKNVELLIESFSKASQENDRLRLLVIGDGPLRRNLAELVELMDLDRRVFFSGLVPYQEIPRYLRSADAFVTASITEVHPYAVIEAMATGLPVIGIRSPGVADIVTDKMTGLIVLEEDLASLSQAMVQMAEGEEQRRRMGINAKQDAQKYDIELTSEQMLSRYQALIDAATQKRTQRKFKAKLLGWG